MKIKKTITDKVLKANRENAKHSPGPQSERAKEIVSGNAVKHGILSQKLRFKTKHEKCAHIKLIRDLQKSVDWQDPVARVYAEEFAAATFRRGQCLKLEQSLSRRSNPATELALKTIKNSKVFDTRGLVADPRIGWECKELKMAGKKANDVQWKYGTQIDKGVEREFELNAKFTDPFDKVLRYNRATARDLYRAGRMVERIRRKRKQPSHEAA